LLSNIAILNIVSSCLTSNLIFRVILLSTFPVLHIAEYPTESAYIIVFDIYSSAILRDTIQRHKIRDVQLLERVVKFVFDNVANKFSAKNVADYFKSQQRKIDLNTVYNYLSALEIKDNHPKYVVTMDEFWKDNIEGVKHVYCRLFIDGELGVISISDVPHYPSFANEG